MITVRRSEDRGHADHGWLNAKHSFSFGGYMDRDQMNFRSLRVLNEDVVAGGKGFGMHPHSDMEIITWVLDGALKHKDNMGFEGTIEPGQVQRISAGTGIYHSEANASADEPVHLLQIWLMPDKAGHEPGYDQRDIAAADRDNKLALVAAPVGSDAEGVVLIHQDARMYVADLGAGNAVTHGFGAGRYGWLQVAKGSVSVNGMELNQGDAAMISAEAMATVTAKEQSQVVLFDLA